MKSIVIQKESLDFLIRLKRNNNRDYFNKHKATYLLAQENIINFAEALLQELNKHDHIETASGKKSLHRIYRDVRFSKEKTPYNTHWGGSFRRATKQLRGGYYFHIEPGNTFLAGGFWGPNNDDLQRIREDISFNYEAWDKLFKKTSIIKTFGALEGEQLVTAPRGFDPKHPGIKFLRYKQFILRHDFADEAILQTDFVKQCNAVFKQLRPFFNYMSEVLTTDANGESVL